MLYRLVRPMIRDGSSIPYFVQRIPADVRARAVGLKLSVPCGGETISKSIGPKTVTIRFSLRTREPSEAKLRQAQAAAYLESVWRALREDAPVPLTHKQAVALSETLYRAWKDGDGRERVTAMVHDPETSEWDRDYDGPSEAERVAEWEAAAQTIARLEGDEHAQEQALGPIVNRLLLAKRIRRVDHGTRMTILSEFRRALHDAFTARTRNAEGDYSPDPMAERFPEWRAPGVSASVSLATLYADWRREAEARDVTDSTFKSYGGVVKRFSAFVGHDDASRVTPDDVLRFKDHRLAEGIKPKTIKDSDLAALKAIFSWGVANRRLTSNPADGISLKVGRAAKTREKEFTPDEAKAILTHALRHECSKREATKTCAAKRWVPWLCAYTGARVGEVCQLRKQDVRREGDHWIITITPEAGTVKTKEAREVPLHEHLIELGFGDFVERSADGHLFITKRGRHGATYRNVSKKVGEFVRQVLADRGVAPSHGWRHLFKTRGIEAGIVGRVLDAICGHVPSTAGDAYGSVTLRAKIDAVEKLSRFAV